MFYLSILFILIELYHFKYKDRLYLRNITPTKIDRIFYLFKFFYFIWVIIGLFINTYPFLVLCILYLIRYPIMMIKSSKAFFIYEMSNTFLSLITLIYILFLS